MRILVFIALCLLCSVLLYSQDDSPKSAGSVISKNSDIPKPLSMKTDENIPNSSAPQAEPVNVKSPNAVQADFKLNDKRVDSILASVNGEPISLADVLAESGREEAKLCALYSGQELWEETKKHRKRYLDEIINRKLIYAEFESSPFNVPQQYIEDMIDTLAGEFGDGSRDGLDKKTKKFGTSMHELKEKAKIKVVVEMVVNEQCYKGMTVTPKEIYEYYEAHIDEFTVPPRVSIEMIMLARDGKNKDNFDDVFNEIKDDPKKTEPKIFHSLAALFSDGPNSENGGSLGWIEESKIRKEFVPFLKDAEQGAVVGPIDTEDGIYFLRLVDRKEMEKVPFENAQKNIKEFIERKQRDVALIKYLDDLKAKSIIRYYF